MTRDRHDLVRSININRDVARIIEHTLSQFDHWRDRTSMLQTAVERNGADRKAIPTECKTMRSQIVGSENGVANWPCSGSSQDEWTRTYGRRRTSAR